jgi:hypothetical protein
MQARVVLPDGHRVWLNGVHPRPPAPGEADESLERDAELLLVGRRVADSAIPVVVCGDLNDVAWSHTTRLFQKTSRLLDPRKGRGFINSFHARIPVLRWPLDHFFHSDHFHLVKMCRLPYTGSDHFPVQVILRIERGAAEEQEAPQADAADREEAREVIAEARAEVQTVTPRTQAAAQAPPQRGARAHDQRLNRAYPRRTLTPGVAGRRSQRRAQSVARTVERDDRQVVGRLGTRTEGVHGLGDPGDERGRTGDGRVAEAEEPLLAEEPAVGGARLAHAVRGEQQSLAGCSRSTPSVNGRSGSSPNAGPVGLSFARTPPSGFRISPAS